MRIISIGLLTACSLSCMDPALAQPESGAAITALRAELVALRSEYDARIRRLEKRLDDAQQQAVSTPPTAAVVAPSQYTQAVPATTPSLGNRNAFNPAIGVIFQGQAWAYGNNIEDYLIPGFPLGGEAGPLPEGLALGETEIDISANVDDKFTAWLTAPLVIEDGDVSIEIEEAWIETTSLPSGLSLRMGRFFSNIGYLNDQHAHSWDFADQPLPYQVFLGNQYLDDGLQLRWLAPTDIYLEIGGEVTRGDRYPAGGAGHSGFGSYALHARVGGDIGFSHSWQAGLSYLSTEANDRVSGDPAGPLIFSGDSELMMAEFIWKWAPNGNNRQRNFKFQAEYLKRNEDGIYSLTDGRNLAYNSDQQGWYLQAVFQPIPRWRVGFRWDQLSADNPGIEFTGTPLMPLAGDPKRYSVMADWSNSEFSRLRLQYTRDQASLESDNQWGLQYIFSIGAHGAHSF